ncbi:response regulator [bacterium AH-315-F18]|nr:response regulator [bacterium AH-315-F18]
MPQQKSDRIYSTQKIADLLQVNVKTVGNWIDRGGMKAYRTVGGHRRVQHDHLVEFLQKNKMPLPGGFDESKQRVLIVDDEAETLNFLAKSLAKRNEELQVNTANGGYEALIAVGRFQPHLVILDIMMPDIDGFEVCQKIKSARSKRPASVLAISGAKDDEIQKSILAAGADGFISKSAGVRAILNKVNSLLAAQQAKSP